MSERNGGNQELLRLLNQLYNKLEKIFVYLQVLLFVMTTGAQLEGVSEGNFAEKKKKKKGLFIK